MFSTTSAHYQQQLYKYFKIGSWKNNVVLRPKLNGRASDSKYVTQYYFSGNVRVIKKTGEEDNF